MSDPKRPESPRNSDRGLVRHHCHYLTESGQHHRRLTNRLLSDHDWTMRPLRIQTASLA